MESPARLFTDNIPECFRKTKKTVRFHYSKQKGKQHDNKQRRIAPEEEFQQREQ